MTMRMQKSSNHGTTDNDDDDKTMGEKCRPRTQTLSKLEYECQSKKQQGYKLENLRFKNMIHKEKRFWRRLSFVPLQTQKM